ncbi:uncharacterized protein MELLADRAFT_69115 [Melampsora larici-populina 98AG31]|uniref:Uncharacterized protein n=1 Tax=Melampsora larici-populina (strain 98AG31 / pathotype 3-4-7) TaxID=747676 RepID=F4S9F9_MELLP|nr:uncharacterized protein MELLADRAFT_69115 [Melampsora larici-populina 98AG31]EGF98715.1 hypothetical protein MELLADRAFT_69115 [Melampsora larici-populina 98AG31]
MDNPSSHGMSGQMAFGSIGHRAPPFMTPYSYSSAVKMGMAHPGGNRISSQLTVPNLGHQAPTALAPNTATVIVNGASNPKTNHVELDDDSSICVDELDWTPPPFDELDWTPPFQACSVRVFEATMQSDIATASQSHGKGKAIHVGSVTLNESDEAPIESSIKGPVVEVNIMGSYNLKLSYLMYTEKGVNPLKISSQKLKNSITKWMPYRIDPTTKIIDIDNNSFIALKDILFTVADTIDTDAPAGGNSAIFKLADASGTVTINIYIDRHEVFSRSKCRKLVDDQDVQDFFAAVQDCPLREAGMTISMADPAKSAKLADTKIAMAQTRLKAMSAMNNVTVTASQLTDLLPLDPLQVQLEALIKKYGSLDNHSQEGWRVYKPHEASKYMQMNYEHLHKWAQELAESRAGVDLDNPPMYLEGFKWTDVKRPLSTAAPQHSAKRIKGSDSNYSHMGTPGGYSECQGYHIEVNREELEELKKYCTLEEFLLDTGIAPFLVDDLSERLANHHIDSFEQFLFPDLMNIRNVLALGISWGIAMKLFSQSQLFYQQMKKELATCNRIFAREGPYNFKSSTTTPHSGPSNSTPRARQAGPSCVPDTAPKAGTSRSSGL